MKQKSSLPEFRPDKGDYKVKRKGVVYILNKLEPRRKVKQKAPKRKKSSKVL